MKRFYKVWFLIAIFIVVSTKLAILNAQPTVEDQQERLLLIFTLLHDERLLAAPGVHPDGIKVGVDSSIIPPINTTVGAKEENVNFAPAILRPTLRFDGFNSFFFQIGGTPEIQFNEITTQTFSTKIGLGYNINNLRISSWGSYTEGRIVAPITEPSLPSEDELSFNIAGIGLAFGVHLGNFDPYFAIEYRDLSGRFFIPEDKTTITTTYEGPTYGLGLMSSFLDPLLLTIEIADVPNILTNPRLSFVYRFE